jgi:multidrug efflux pump subunit AcrB
VWMPTLNSINQNFVYHVDRLKASQLGVSVEDISQTLNLALSNRRLGYFTKEGKQYQVMGQVARKTGMTLRI